MSDAVFLPLLDAESIENLRSLGEPGDDSFVKEIVGIYLADTPLRLADLHAKFAEGDLVGFARAAHTIKGSSANVGANRVRRLAEHLETAAKVGLHAGLTPDIAALAASFAATEAEFQRVLGL
jgi:histidine phosphotransfer protein HptB